MQHLSNCLTYTVFFVYLASATVPTLKSKKGYVNEAFFLE